MDIFDQFLFDEIVKEYSRADLSSEDYEEIYQRFLNIEHVPEVKPYLLAMRFLGLGTEADQDEVLTELRSYIDSNDAVLCGLYYDLLLFKNKDDYESGLKLLDFLVDGYSDAYLKDKSHIKYDEDKDSEYDGDDDYDDIEDIEDDYQEEIVFERMEFEAKSLSGLYFTTRDVDYLNAKVFIKPVKKACHIKVRSQIFDGDDSFSKIFCNEYDLKPGDTWFRTTGWGNKNCSCYYSGVYKWIIEINGTDTYSQEFRMYNGKIDRVGPRLTDVKLFASKATGALKADQENYKRNFEGCTLEHVYFKAFMDEPGSDICVQFFIKLICLENNRVIYDGYTIHELDYNTYACWESIGYDRPGNWQKGLYKYTVRLGNSKTIDGNFTVY